MRSLSEERDIQVAKGIGSNYRNTPSQGLHPASKGEADPVSVKSLLLFLWTHCPHI